MLITCTTGNENLEAAAAKSFTFHVLPNVAEARDAEQSIFRASRDAGRPGVTLHGASQWHDAVPGFRDEFGKWSTTTYDVRPGEVLKVFGQRKLATQGPGRLLNASVYFQVQDYAPLVRMTMATTGDPRCAFTSVVSIEGRLQVLMPEDLRGLGINVCPAFRPQMDPDVVSTVFCAVELEPGTAPAIRHEQRHTTDNQGREVVVNRRRRARAIDL